MGEMVLLALTGDALRLVAVLVGVLEELPAFTARPCSSGKGRLARKLSSSPASLTGEVETSIAF